MLIGRVPQRNDPAARVALTRQLMINDDLGAFLQIPRAIGRMSALALEEVVFTLLLANSGNFLLNFCISHSGAARIGGQGIEK